MRTTTTTKHKKKKKQENSLEVLNEMERRHLWEMEFRIMVFRVLNSMRKDIEKGTVGNED